MFTLSSVVPRGRSYDEYVRMFALSDADLADRPLGCGDGPASFNSEATRRGGRVVSCDPLYQCDAAQIRQRIDETSAEVLRAELEDTGFTVTIERVPYEFRRGGNEMLRVRR